MYSEICIIGFPNIYKKFLIVKEINYYNKGKRKLTLIRNLFIKNLNTLFKNFCLYSDLQAYNESFFLYHFLIINIVLI